MTRTLTLAFLALTALVCLGVYRVAEQARVARADLTAAERGIAREQAALAVLGAEWARVTAPARIQALASRHLDLADQPTVALSSLSALPRRNDALVPEGSIRNADVTVPSAPLTPTPVPVQTAPAEPAPQMTPIIVALQTGI